jgi:hypothetical protein
MDRRQERFFVRLGGLVETTDFSNELKGRSLNFLWCYGWIEVE